MRKKNDIKEKSSTNPSKIVGEGFFRKCSSGSIKSWKIRLYYIRSDRMLSYYDPNDVTEAKGFLDISKVSLSLGDQSNIIKSGIKFDMKDNAIPLQMLCFADQRNMDLVFESTTELKNFLISLSNLSYESNVEEFLALAKIRQLLPDGIGQNASPASSEMKIVGKGTFRKEGSGFKNWKVRNYVIEGCDSKVRTILRYFDPLTNVEKGSFDISALQMVLGNEQHLEKSGSLDFCGDEGVSVILQSRCQEERKNTMNVVFDSMNILRLFCKQVESCTVNCNIQDFLEQAIERSHTQPSYVASVGHESEGLNSRVVLNARPVSFGRADSEHDRSTFFRPQSAEVLTEIGKGTFRKAGRNAAQTWTLRSYTVSSNISNTDAVLQYFDTITGEEKGSIIITSVQVSIGLTENINKCGYTDLSQGAVSLSLVAEDDEFRNLDIVFESMEETKTFLQNLLLASAHNNVPDLCTSLGVELKERKQKLRRGGVFVPANDTLPLPTAGSSSQSISHTSLSLENEILALKICKIFLPSLIRSIPQRLKIWRSQYLPLNDSFTEKLKSTTKNAKANSVCGLVVVWVSCLIYTVVVSPTAIGLAKFALLSLIFVLILDSLESCLNDFLE